MGDPLSGDANELHKAYKAFNEDQDEHSDDTKDRRPKKVKLKPCNAKLMVSGWEGIGTN
jgi:hypothetical protein